MATLMKLIILTSIIALIALVLTVDYAYLFYTRFRSWIRRRRQRQSPTKHTCP